jgi:hypothetical protein
MALVAAGWAFLSGLGGTSAQPSFTISPVALVGDPTPLGGRFAKFEDRPNLNAMGDVLFLAQVVDGDVPRGLFLFSQGRITKVVAAGDAAPIGGTFQRFSLGWRSPTRTGVSAFVATVTGGKAPVGLFLLSKGKIVTVAAEGSPAPGGGTFGTIAAQSASANDDEVVAFEAALKGTSASAGIFLFSRGALKKLIAEGDATPIGGAFGRSFTRPLINSHGQVAVSASIKGGPAAEAIFLASGGKLTALVRAGDSAPGTAGARFTSFKDLDFTDRGEVAFRAYLAGGRPRIEGYPSLEGFFLASPQGVVKLAASGDRMPDGGILAKTVGQPIVNARGTIFVGKMKKNRGHGIFLASGNTLTKVAADSDPTPVDGVFGTLASASFNDAGAVAFRTGLIGGRSSEGIFLAEMDHVKFGEALFRANCSVCHSLDIPKSMEFNRAGWEGLVEDMATELGATWIGPRERKIIVDYLVEQHGEK